MSQFQLPLSPSAHPLETRPFRTTLPQLSASFSWQGNINFNCGSFSIQWEMLIQFSNSKRVALRHYSFGTPSASATPLFLSFLSVSRCGGYLRSICLARRASKRCLFAYQLADSSHSCSSYNYKYGYIYRCTDSYSYRYRNNTTVTDTDKREGSAGLWFHNCAENSAVSSSYKCPAAPRLFVVILLVSTTHYTLYTLHLFKKGLKRVSRCRCSHV